MKATVKTRFYGAADGQIYPRWVEPGTVIDGDEARTAVDAGWAEEIGGKKPPLNAALPGAPFTAASRPGQVSPETTAKRRGRPPKSSSQ